MTADFRCIRAGPYLWRLRPDAAVEEEWLRAPEKLAADDARLVKRPAPGAGTRVVRINSGERNYILKEYRPERASARLKALFRKPAAVSALQTCMRLERLGLPVVPVVGAGYRRRSPGHCFLLTRELAAIVPFRDYVRRRQPRAHAILLLARLLGKLHSANFVHRDAHLANFVVQTDGKPVVTIIDVDAVRPCRSVTLALAARDIGRLLDYSEPSQREMMRFAVVYARARAGAISSRALMREMRGRYEKRARLKPARP